MCHAEWGFVELGQAERKRQKKEFTEIEGKGTEPFHAQVTTKGWSSHLYS